LVPFLESPRICGEKYSLSIVRGALFGSPPLMRGKSLKVPIQKDHPRMCGEKPLAKLHALSHIRITPARAGKTDSFQPTGTHPLDHPRSCGERVLKSNFKRITPARAGKGYRPMLRVQSRFE